MTIDKGKTISMRLPLSLPQHILQYLREKKKEKEKNFSSYLLAIIIKHIESEIFSQNEIRIRLSSSLSKKQMQWIEQEENQLFLVNILMCGFKHAEKKEAVYSPTPQLKNQMQNDLSVDTIQFISENFFNL